MSFTEVGFCQKSNRHKVAVNLFEQNWKSAQGINTNERACNVGLDNKSKQLLYFDSSNESAKRSLKFSLAALERTGSLFVQTDLVDQHCYIFNRQAVLEILESKPTIHSIKEVGAFVSFKSWKTWLLQRLGKISFRTALHSWRPPEPICKSG